MSDLARPRKSKTAYSTGAGKGCPICGKPTVARFRPFCSAICADIDLGRWLNNQYRIPSQEPPGETEGVGDDGEEPDR
jgi:hypothetical protein